MLFSTRDCSATTIITYPAPTGSGATVYQNNSSATGNTVSSVVLSSNYTVTVNGSPIPVYFYQAAMGYFDFSGGTVTVQVTVNSNIPLQSAVVRPLRLGISPQISGQTITFTVSNPQNLDVEINGDTNNPLYIFANPIDATAPAPGQSTVNGMNVFYYGPGIYNIGGIVLPSNTRVYIAGGAIVYGHFYTNSTVSNSSITGRGIIVADDTMYLTATNLLLEGFIITSNDHSGHWTMRLNNCSSATVDNIKSFPWQDWGQDGLDLCGSQNVVVKNSCIRSLDDCIAIKSFNGTGGGDVLNHEIFNNVVWCMGQNAFEIGFEFNCDVVNGIYYHDDDIIHYTGGKAALGIHDLGWGGTPGKGEITNVLYQRINVEQCENNLVDIICAPSSANLGNAWGTVMNITYRDINLYGSNPGSSIQIGGNYYNNMGINYNDPGSSFMPVHTVENVTFENLRINGAQVLNAGTGGFNIGANAQNIQFVSGPTGAPTSPMGLSAQATSSTSTFLKWTDNAADEGGFSIERSSDGTNFSVIKTVYFPNQTSFSDTGLAPGTEYYYRIRSFNDFNTLSYSAYTGVATASTLASGVQVPVDAYLLTDGQGTTASDSTGGNSGNLIGSPLPTWISTGGLSFLGNGQYNQTGGPALQVANDLSPILGGTSSLMFWINTTQAGNGTHWMAPAVTGVEETGVGDDINWGYIDGSGHIGVAVGDNGSCVSSQAINDGNWHRVALTRDASSGIVNVYVDGALSNTGTFDFGSLTSPFNLIGANSVYESGYATKTGANYLNAKLDDVQVFDQVLTPGAVAGYGMVVSAGSQLVHGGAGTFSLPLNLTGTPTVEPRTGSSVGAYNIVVNFSAPITALTTKLALQNGQSGTVVGSAAQVTLSSPTTTVTIPLSGVGNKQRLNLQLSGILPGGFTANIPINILWGDVNQNGGVSTADVNLVRSVSGAPITAQNYLDDVNANGGISTADVNLVRSLTGTSLP